MDLASRTTNYLDMLDGLLLETAIYDHAGNLLESQTNSWQVLNNVASDPQDASAPLIRLFGGWTARTAQTKVVDGVTRTEETSFVPAALKAPYTGTASRCSFGIVQWIGHCGNLDQVLHIRCRSPSRATGA